MTITRFLSDFLTFTKVVCNYDKLFPLLTGIIIETCCSRYYAIRNGEPRWPRMSHVCPDIYTACRDTLMDKSDGEGSFYYY